jgi:FtsX-like permease family
VLRRIAFPLQLVAARLRFGGQRLLLVAVGVVAGSAVLAAVLGGRLVMQDRALAQATARLDPGDRTVQVAWSGADARVYPSLDRFVAPRLQTLTGRAPARAMLFREASIQGRLVNIRAADDLGRYVKLVSGRLPTVCRPSHCEVLRLEGKGPIPSTPQLRLIEVGRAVLRPDAPFAPFVLPAPHTQEVAQAVRYHTPQPSPIVIANGVAGLARTPELETFYRSYAWFVPIGRGDVHPWSLGAFSREVQAVTASIEAHSDLLQVTAPTDELGTAAQGSRAAARRLLLLGGESGALLLAFTILAAATLRRDVGDTRRRLIFFGARRWQVELFTLTESAVLAAVATVVGWVVGGAVAAAVASRAGSPAGQVVTHALLSTGGILAALAIAAAAALLLYATVRAGSLQFGRLAITPLDVAALGAIGVVAVGWARGSVDADQLAGGNGTGAFLLLVPALIVFAASVACARLLAPALRGLGRAGRSGPIALRLAANSLARNPGHAAIAATFLVASLGLALFAIAYRSTLLHGQHDEASYAVPASFVLAEDLSQLIPVLHGAPASAYPAAPEQVLRLSGNVSSGATFGFLGLPWTRLAATGGWRGDFAPASLADLGRRLEPTRDQSLRTDALPPGRRFGITVSATGDDVTLVALFRSALGDYEPVTLGRTHGATPVRLEARIPFVHATLAQVELDLLNGGRRSANGGIGIQPSAKGILSLSDPEVNGKPVAHPFASWLGTGGVSFDGADRVGYLLTPDERGIFRPRQPTDGHVLPVLVTPGIAAEAGPHGILPLQVEGQQVAGRVVGVVDRFPSIVGEAVIADRTTASTMLDASSPGLGTIDELWLNVPAERDAATAALLSRPPFTALTVSSRSALLAQLQSDPLARGALVTLAGTAVVAVVLALVGLLLVVVGDVRDDRGELFDLEAQGASPATIRGQLRLRAALVAAFGTLGGIALGAILSALVISLVAVTAGATVPEPPLQLSLDLPLLALTLAGYLVVAAALVGFATRTRGRAPARAAEAAA